ncbi:MAG: hypothetical protein ACI9MC_004047 [Kiritimatiellia bacterium]|jgi:hypothetical protein
MRVCLIWVAVASAACVKSVVPEYELRRDDALATADVPARWTPDAVLMLSPNIIDNIVHDGIEERGTFKRKIELAGSRHHVSPSLSITELDVLPGGSCPSCFTLHAALQGSLTWRIGGSAGEMPLSGDIVFEVSFQARRDTDGWLVEARPRSVQKARISLDNKTYRTVRVMAQSALDDWAAKHAFDAFEPIVLKRFDDDGLPVLAVRPVRTDNGLRLDLLTAATVHELVDEPIIRPDEDWALQVSQRALLAEVRRAAFAHGPVSHGVHLEPLAIDIKEGTFTLDLRLWRLKGRGWWRDVRIHGSHLHTSKGVELRALDVDEVGQSKGAALVDPLAALAEGQILKAIEHSMQTVLPDDRVTAVGDRSIQTKITRFSGRSRTLRVGGTLSVDRISRKEKRPVPSRVGDDNR